MINNFQNDTFHKLGFDIILTKLQDNCSLLVNKDQIILLKRLDNREVDNELNHTLEYLNFIARYSTITINQKYDLKKLLDLAKKGMVLNSLELYDFTHLLSSLNQFVLNIQKCSDLGYLNNLANNIFPLTDLLSSIRNTIDYDGLIFDNASSDLRRIRTELRNIDNRIKNRLNEIINKEKNKLADSIITIRNNHYCVMVKAEFKNSFSGMVVDSSQSMQTFYMTPLSVLEIENKKSTLIEEEKREINRILTELSKLVNQYYDELSIDYDLLIRLDFLQAKAILAKSMDAYKVNVTEGGNFDLINAYNPLLNVEKVIPNSVNFQSHLGIIITGPNTGGKTVLLKTVGLMVLMTEYGLLIPASEATTIKLYDQVYCDIGDDQDILANLSTFSSHIKKLTHIIENVTTNSLVIIDEIGSGTDPVEGSSLSIAVLDYFVNHHISFIVTTHYSKLKEYGYSRDEVVNASMLFDNNSLKPTYRLSIGTSGASNAIKIATNLGMKEEIIQKAKELYQGDDSSSQNMIDKIEKMNQDLIEKEKLLNDRATLLNQEITTYQQKIKEIDNKNNILTQKAIASSEQILNDAKKKAKELIVEAEKLVKDGVKLHEIANVKHQLKDNLDFDLDLDDEDSVEEINVGDSVYLKNLGQYATVVKMGKKITIKVGNATMVVEADEIKKTNNKEVKKSDIKIERTSSELKMNKSVSMKLDLRGKRYDEASILIDKYLDDLLLMNIKTGLIIHGYGSGTMRNLVIEKLKNDRNVKSFNLGSSDVGGHGVTQFELK